MSIKIIGPEGHILRSKDIIKEQKNLYLLNPASAWLHKAANIKFKNPVEPIEWLLKNKPKYEIHSLDTLVSCLGRVQNISDKKKMGLFHIYVNAYTYILRNVPARNEIKDVFNTFIKEGKKLENITPGMISYRMDLFLFTHLDNKDKYLKIGYINTMIEVFLYFKRLELKNELYVPEFK